MLRGDDQRRAAAAADRLHGVDRSRRESAAPPLPDKFADAVGRALADHVAVEIHAAHAGLGGEGDEFGMRQFVDLAAADAVFFLGEHDDAAAFGGFIGEG